jgi:hypothetical protein
MEHFFNSLSISLDFSSATGAAPTQRLSHKLGHHLLQGLLTIEMEQISSSAHEVF